VLYQIFYTLFLFLPKVNHETVSDTVKISQFFSKVNGKGIPVILSSIQGPYAFIYLDVKRQHLYFGRDRLGRHSLLWSTDSEEGFVLTSVGKRNVLDFKEVPTVGIFMIDMNSSGTKADDLCLIYTRTHTVFIMQAYQTSQYMLPRGGIFLGKWRSSF
jgi:asparagine synthetase B (glutamine-hydrolysing)